MPSISPPAKVLVTGASGFLGLHIVQNLLNKGYSVRGTVRDDKKGKIVADLIKNNKFEYVLVPEIEAPGAFDEAVKDIDAVIHSASPLGDILEKPDKIIGPAVAGTVGVLESAEKYGSKVRRVVITSSNVAVDYPVDEPKIFTESDWNEPSVVAIKEQGESVSEMMKYMASKTLAEKAAWDYIKSHGNLHFDITTICPPYIVGPSLNAVKTVKDIPFSNVLVISAAIKNIPTDEESLAKRGSWIDVRDCANIHIDVLSNDKASNERFISAAGEWTWQDIYDALHQEPAFSSSPRGIYGATKGKVYDTKLDSSKLQSALGVTHDQTYRPFSETIRDAAKQYRGIGLL